jgi:hypothetical protein
MKEPDNWIVGWLDEWIAGTRGRVSFPILQPSINPTIHQSVRFAIRAKP